MSSPEVWAAVRPKLQAAADALGLAIHWPNEAAEEPEADGSGNLPIFLAVDIEAEGGEPIEIAGTAWRESGTVWVHVLLPSGAGIADGLAARKAVADGFRATPPGALHYIGFMFPSGGRDEASGNWYRLSLGIGYRFTDA